MAGVVDIQKRVGRWEVKSMENFCESNNAVIFCDHTSKYYGKYKVLYSIVVAQAFFDNNVAIDLLIHIGEVSGEYYQLRNLKPRKVWRVNEDGEIRNYFGNLEAVLEMPEATIFKSY